MKNKNNGITLIALVVTIVVLLILAGISISLLTGENGVITQARKSKEETRGGTVEEQRDIWRSNKKTDKQTGDSTSQTLDELLEDLKSKGYLTDGEVDQIKDKGFVVIGSHYIDFEQEEEIDWSKLEPGLYKTGTAIMIKSWQQLIDDYDIRVGSEKGYYLWDNHSGGTNKLWNINSSIDKGDLIISSDITVTNGNYSSNSCSMSGIVGLTGIYIPSSVEEFSGFIAQNRFVKKVVIAEGVKKISDNAFRTFDNLTSISIPSSVTSIEVSSFYGCDELTSISVSEDNQTYDSRNNCNAIIKTSTNKLVQGCKNTIIPDSVTCIGASAFSGYSNLTNITIPDSVTSIEDDAFSNCTGLENISIPSSVTNIGCNAFERCTNLKNIIMLGGVTNIEAWTFVNCAALTSITIPKTVISIGDCAFSNCNNLTTVNYTGTEEDWQKITIGSRNEILQNATINYNYK